MSEFIDTSISVSPDDGSKVINNFSIIVTERCNLKCTYCHFYKAVSRSSTRDIPDALFEHYMNFLRYFHNTVGGEVTYRFSGGDPIVLGDRLFDLANRGYEISGLKPYFLTAGNGIDEKWIDKARKSAFTHAFVSLENPLHPDPGSVDPYETIQKIIKYSMSDFKLEFGVTVVKNEYFKDIYEICKIVFYQTGKLPSLREVNYLPYESPTERQLQDLYENMVRVVSEFHDKAPLNMFSYISPEFSAAHDGKNSYLSELNMDNPHHVGEVSQEQSMQNIIEKQKLNYPANGCTEIECDWYNHCQRIKWLWQKPSASVSGEQKIKDYCRFKKAINSAFFDALLGGSHERGVLNEFRLLP